MTTVMDKLSKHSTDLQTATPPATALIPSANPPVHVPTDSIAQCSLHFELQTTTYPTERTNVAYVISPLSGF